MPELPEVEVTRASLADRLDGGQVLHVQMGKPLRWPLGIAPLSLVGQRVGLLQRRGKYLWLPLAAPRLPADVPGDRPVVAAGGGLLLHLGMSGSLNLADAPGAAGPHDHFELTTSRGVLRLTDPRRFGAVVWSSGLDAAPAATLLARLGAEPFDPALTPERFHAALQGRHSAIKTTLLAGDIVVGAGNIYVSEALFHAGIDPRQRSDRLSRPRCARLLQALRQTLARAIELGGSTLRDFRDAHGASGAFQHQVQVYGRAGQPCLRCGTIVRKIVQLQRSSFFCGHCQRR